MTRRGLLLGTAAAALAAPLVAAGRWLRGPSSRELRETYKGRRIAVTGTHVTIDDRPLHLMRRADGTWLSMVDHYCSYATPHAAARAAVDALGPRAQLTAMGGRHGVHA